MISQRQHIQTGIIKKQIMYAINGWDIELTKGDTFITKVGAKHKDTGETYTPVDGLRF